MSVTIFPPKTEDPREIKKWREAVSNQINANTKAIEDLEARVTAHETAYP